MEAFRESVYALAERIRDMVTDPDQFYRHLIEVKGENRFEEVVTDKADTRALRDMAATVKDMGAALRDMDGDGETHGGVILLPEAEDDDA